jgi:hypothetical protein
MTMPDQYQHPESGSADSSISARAGSSGAAAAVTGDNADAGEWPDDIAADRGSSRGEGGGSAQTPRDDAVAQPKDDSADNPVLSSPDEDEAAKLGDFA